MAGQFTLYVKDGCPYCSKVRAVVAELGIEVTEKEVHDPGVREELVLRGGKKTVPFLVDEARDVHMYESDAIIAYLEETYGERSGSTKTDE